MISYYPDADRRQTSDLRPMLHRWAARYTCDAHLREQLVSATVFTLAEDPYLIDRDHVRRSVLKVLVRITREAMSKTDWRKGPFDVELYPEGERYIVRLRKGYIIEKMRFINRRCASDYVKALKKRSLVRKELRLHC